jgi:hypothetical protein
MADTYGTLDPRQTIPAPPGWVARRLRLNEKNKGIEVDYLPVVAWAVGTEIHGGREPIVWNIGAGEIGIPAELEHADDWTGFIDTYLFDPVLLDTSPDVDESAARKRLMDPDDFKAFEDGRRQNQARLVGHAPTD